MERDADFAQRHVLDLVVHAHPAMLTIDDLRRDLSDVCNVDEAIAHLANDGLVSRLGDMVGASRAAVRAHQLAL